MDNRFRPWRTILFVVLTLGLLAFTYILVLRIDFGGSTSVTVRFGAVGTIQSGSPVRQSGVKVGSVSRVRLAPDRRGAVDVELSLYQGLIVRMEDRISIVAGGLLGDQFIDIVPGPAEAPVAGPEVVLTGQSGLDLKVLVDGGGDLIRDLSVSSRAVSQFLARHETNLDQIVADAQRGVKHAADAAERADHLLAQAEAAWDPTESDVREAVRSLKETSQALKTLVEGLSGPGSMVDLLSKPGSAKAASDTLENLKQSSQSLKTVTTALEKALQ